MDVQTKSQLTTDLKNAFLETIEWVNQQPADHFNMDMVSGKWTIAGHLYHLIKSTKAVSQGMKMPKAQLEGLFGKINRAERSYEGMIEKYTRTINDVKFKTPNPYEAEAGRTFDQPSLIKRFEHELDQFISVLENWKEDDMGNYVMPHPAMGKCTMREFCYFTILHTYHHLNLLKMNYSSKN